MYKEKKTEYTPLKDLSALLKPEDPICLVQVYDGTITREDGRTVCDIGLPELSRVAIGNKSIERGGYSFAARNVLENPQDINWFNGQIEEYKRTNRAVVANNTNPLRFAAGGALAVTNDGYVILIKRDSKAPTYKGYLTAATGLSQFPEQIEAPAKIIPWELQEELCVLDSNGCLHPLKYDGTLNQELAESRAQITGVQYLDVAEPISARKVDAGDSESKLIVHDHIGRILSDDNAILNFDPEHGGIDALGIVELGISYEDIRNGDYSIIDTEVFGTDNQRTERDIVFVPVSSFQSGNIEGFVYNYWKDIFEKTETFDPLKITPVAKQTTEILKQLDIYT